MGLTSTLPDVYLPREYISASFKIIDPVHGVIHDGTHFTAHYYTTTSSAVAVSITAPEASEEKYIHFVASVETNKAALWRFCKEATTGTAITGGTVLTSYNNFQSSSITDPATLLKERTVTTLGTVLETHIIGGEDTNQSKTGGGAEARNEWILEPGETYFLYVVPDGADTRVLVNLPYYYRERS
jgi:hypothetical protein